MQTISINDISGEKFPSGRHTRVFIGAHSKLQAENFVSGFVIIEPNGSVPLHDHEQEEVYYILKGKGEMTVEAETQVLDGVSAVYIPPNTKHTLKNIGSEELHMLFVYSPAGIVSHWHEEREGHLK
ncbi:MAG: cupin domain-containing protein [Desulfobacterales bacterium]|nr:MAG: cupin domain-containing protein [Desulfobacterales bacterium]